MIYMIDFKTVFFILFHLILYLLLQCVNRAETVFNVFNEIPFKMGGRSSTFRTG